MCLPLSLYIYLDPHIQHSMGNKQAIDIIVTESFQLISHFSRFRRPLLPL